MRRTVTIVSLVMLLTVVSSAAMAAEKALNALPRFEGQSFVTQIGAPGQERMALLNVTAESVALYLYSPKEHLLRLMWAVPAQASELSDGWHVSVPEKRLEFELRVAEDGKVSFDGKPSALKFISATELEGLRVDATADCSSRSTLEAEPGPGLDPDVQLKGNHVESNMAWCGFALVFGGCCDACYCVHRSLDIPYWVDAICCLGSC